MIKIRTEHEASEPRESDQVMRVLER